MTMFKKTENDRKNAISHACGVLDDVNIGSELMDIVELADSIGTLTRIGIDQTSKEHKDAVLLAVSLIAEKIIAEERDNLAVVRLIEEDVRAADSVERAKKKTAKPTEEELRDIFGDGHGTESPQ